jgi:hypothetical protein
LIDCASVWTVWFEVAIAGSAAIVVGGSGVTG